jgi:diguanylate cyclase (GGDEF)-like protein
MPTDQIMILPAISYQTIDYRKEMCLIVDDEKSIRETLVESLQLLEFQAKASVDGNMALEELEREKCTFLITDMKMPGMNGLQLIQKARIRYPEICIIAMTAHAKGYKYIDVINAGATDFINKPFSTDELEAKIKRAILERNTKLELNRLSITDSLTGLYNQRHFYLRLREEITRARRQKGRLSLILLDLDNFKWFNDTYGHLAGDELLQKTGTIIRASIRVDVDSGFRYGGDEFAVILIDAEETVTNEIGKRIATVLKTVCGIGASMGFAQYSDDMEAEELMSTADKDLYRAKGDR